MNKKFIKALSIALRLTKTDIEIILVLISYKGGLLINEIIKKSKRSERNIRKRINFLIKKGILHRKIEVLKNKRIAYRYFIESKNKIIKEAKKNLIDYMHMLS
jgi:predicted transcriptional regulator